MGKQGKNNDTPVNTTSTFLVISEVKNSFLTITLFKLYRTVSMILIVSML